MFGSSALVAMEDKDEERLNLINQAGSEYATVDCYLKEGEEGEKCLQIKSSLREFALGMRDIRGHLHKCEGLREEGPYTSHGSAQFTTCMKDVESLVKNLINEQYEKLNGIGFSPSS